MQGGNSELGTRVCLRPPLLRSIIEWHVTYTYTAPVEHRSGPDSNNQWFVFVGFSMSSLTVYFSISKLSTVGGAGIERKCVVS